MTSRILSVAVAAAVMGGALSVTPVKAETEILFNRFVPAKHPFNVGMFIPWAKDVERVTNGSVKVKFTEKSLAPPPKQWNMVSKGIADAAMLANNFESGRLKLPNIAQIPFGASSAEKRGLAMWRTHVKYLAKANEYKGMKLLGQWTVSAANILADKPITKMSDLKNYKIWAINGIPNKMMKNMGAVVVSVPGVKMFNVVSKGIVKGSVTSEYTLMVFKLMPYIKHITTIPGGFQSNNFSFLFSLKKWNGLSAAEKKAITSISGDTIAVNAGKRVDFLDTKARGLAKKKGIKYHTASPEFVADFRKNAQFAVDDFLKVAASKGVDGKAALDFFKSQF
ncbi:MAG: TRAP transporter substrate-binding protein DctP [Rhodospirillaceae bacterium]|jgi:TRAP-type transport system periplasmic protein|nr:TRAP transporter substrate-binding protein DctP [Rhodospirillaceae bacterium]